MLHVKAGPYRFSAEESDNPDFPGILLKVGGLLVGALEYYTESGEVKIHAWPTVKIDDEEPTTTVLSFD